MEKPSLEVIAESIQAASAAHHEFETNALHGERDEQWNGWYAAYMLGRLGDVVSPSKLATWLSSAPDTDDWPNSAAGHIEAMWGIS